MVQCSILLNGRLNEDVGLNGSQDEKIKNWEDGKADKDYKADEADRVKRGVSHMTLYNRYGTQLSIPEKPKPLILLFPKNQIPENLNPSKYIYGVVSFYKKIC